MIERLRCVGSSMSTKCDGPVFSYIIFTGAIIPPVCKRHLKEHRSELILISEGRDITDMTAEDIKKEARIVENRYL